MNLFIEEKSSYTDYRIPAMTISDKGIIYVAFECREDKSDWAQIDMRIMKSTDNGANFQEIKKICGQGETLNNPVLIVKEDIVHFIYCKNYSHVYHIVSRDEGDTWEETKELTNIFENFTYTVVATGPGHGIVTEDGALVLPVWFAYNLEDIHEHKPSFVSTIYSEDDGETWQTGEILEGPELIDANESTMALLQNGSVLISIRNRHPEKRMRYLAVSPTGYDQWKFWGYDERFVDPKCMGSLCNGDDMIFFCNCESTEKRENLILKISKDDFKHVEKILISKQAGYSEIAYYDNQLFVLYETYEECDGERINHRLQFDHINLANL